MVGPGSYASDEGLAKVLPNSAGFKISPVVYETVEKKPMRYRYDGNLLV